MRPALVLAMALLGAGLGGCAVTSDQPLFAVDQAPRRPLRDGLWAITGPGCEVRPLKPAEPLPECVGETLTIAGSRMSWEMIRSPTAGLTGAQLKAAMGAMPMATDFVLVDGDPAIIEMLNGKTAGFAGSPPPNPAAIKVGYLSLRALEQDAQGRIVRGVLWPAPCPDNPQPQGFKAPAPPSGLGATATCQAETPEAVRAQAPHMKPFLSFFVTWVR